LISDRYNFIFFHVPKAAGTSVTKALNKSLTGDVLMNENNKGLKSFLSKKGKLWPNHATCGEVRSYLSNERYNKYFKFCFVRNPWDRLVSLYHYTVQKEAKIYADKGLKLPQFSQDIMDADSFENWITSEKFGTAQYYFLSNNNQLLVDFVGRSESLQADFSYVCGLVGIPNIILPKENVSKHKKYQQYYNNETRQIVAERYKKDIELFGYTYEEQAITEMLAINKEFLNSQPFIKIIGAKNDNKYCRFTYNILNEKENIHLHPNDINEKDFELKFLLQGSLKKPISNLNFFCNAYNENKENPGVLIEYEIINKERRQLILHEKRLTPRLRENIAITFKSQEKCFLNLKIKNVPGTVSNKFCGVRLNNFTLN